MQTLYFPKTTEIKRAKSKLEKKLNIKITIQGRKVSFSAKNSINEYEASLVLDAISFGFSADKALLLKEEDMIFRKIHIKDFTRKKNLKDVKARLIGAKGKTKNTIEKITDCHIIIGENEIGVIGNAESIEELITALTNLIRGTKQSHTYRFLERTNQQKGKIPPY